MLMARRSEHCSGEHGQDYSEEPLRSGLVALLTNRAPLEPELAGRVCAVGKGICTGGNALKAQIVNFVSQKLLPEQAVLQDRDN